jgi:hypothetical protein
MIFAIAVTVIIPRVVLVVVVCNRAGECWFADCMQSAEHHAVFCGGGGPHPIHLSNLTTYH